MNSVDFGVKPTWWKPMDRSLGFVFMVWSVDTRQMCAVAYQIVNPLPTTHHPPPYQLRNPSVAVQLLDIFKWRANFQRTTIFQMNSKLFKYHFCWICMKLIRVQPESKCTGSVIPSGVTFRTTYFCQKHFSRYNGFCWLIPNKLRRKAKHFSDFLHYIWSLRPHHRQSMFWKKNNSVEWCRLSIFSSLFLHQSLNLFLCE